MKCDKCDKPAVVHEVTISNGQKKEIHLCLDHAREAGVSMPGQQPINKLLSKFSSSGKPAVMAPRCPECDTSFAQIRQNSLIGCPSCYDTFDEPLGRFIERAQAGATHHVGRGVDQECSKSSRRREERQLMRALETALNREQYEKAAEIRDRINQLSAELETRPEEAHDGSEGVDQ